MIRLKVEMVDCMGRICWDGILGYRIYGHRKQNMYVGMGYVNTRYVRIVSTGYVGTRCHDICMGYVARDMSGWDTYVGMEYVGTRYAQDMLAWDMLAQNRLAQDMDGICGHKIHTEYVTTGYVGTG